MANNVVRLCKSIDHYGFKKISRLRPKIEVSRAT